MQTAACFAMMRMASPALPIGGYSYSQALEAAIERRWVTDEASAVRWLHECLSLNVGRFEAPICHAMFTAGSHGSMSELERLHALYLASRETRELLAESKQMGYSLVRMLASLHDVDPTVRRYCQKILDDSSDCALPLAWAWATRAFELTPQQALDAYLWAWLENQVAAAIKTIPLGQQAGQNMLSELTPVVTRASQAAAKLQEQDWSNLSPGFVFASCAHEQQYSRLFRS